jgi:ribosomal protein S1
LPDAHQEIGARLKLRAGRVNRRGIIEASPAPMAEEACEKVSALMNEIVSTTVLRVEPFGIIVSLDPFVSGLVHRSEFGHGDNFKPGDEVRVRLTGARPARIKARVTEFVCSRRSVL